MAPDFGGYLDDLDKNCTILFAVLFKIPMK